MKAERCSLPDAPKHVGRAVTRLAYIRQRMRELKEEASGLADTVIKYGSCRTKRYAAYVSHSTGHMYTSYKKASDSVRIVRFD